jgi:hypothetical protein
MTALRRAGREVHVRGAARRSRPDGGRERGAALVEAALVSPLIIVLLFGLLEFGMLFKDYLTVANATRAGARIGSAEGSNPQADYQILQSIKGASSAMSAGDIQRIVVFKASASNGTVPQTCKDGTPGSTCNVYVATDMNRPSSDFGCGAGQPDNYWCPTTRKDNQADPPDYIGVYIKAQHNWITGLFGSSRMMGDTTVMRIEPQP